MERAVRKNRSDVAAEIESELVTSPFPTSIQYIWDAWVRLRRRKALGFNGHVAIEWPDIDAFMRRTSIDLSTIDLELIEALDDLYLESQSDEARDRDSQQAIADGVKAAGKG